MISEIIAAAQSAKTLTDLLKATSEMKNFNEISAAVSEVNIKLMEAQSSALIAQEKQSSLITRVSELEQKLAKFEDWNSESERYQLHSIGPEVFTYVLKTSMANGEPHHQLCVNCFNKGIKAILELECDDRFITAYHCKRCDKKTIVDHRKTL